VDKDNVALFGAQAVNAYVNDARATHDVDIMSPNAETLAEELRSHISQKFHIATRVREMRDGVGYRIYQLQKDNNRHLVDVRSVAVLPPTQRVAKVLVLAPAELIASKLIAWQRRAGTPKSFTDQRDIAVLLLKFPELKTDLGPVADRLAAARADEATLAAWKTLVSQDIHSEDDDDGY
jgi:molybdopterin converting factor small subunit